MTDVTAASATATDAPARTDPRPSGAPAPRLAGNFQTGGAGMPRISGQLERRAGGMTLIRMAMADYAAKGASLAIPQMMLAQGPDGTLGFVGNARVSGAIPEGSVKGLEVPLDGRWAPGRQLELWRGCRQIRFNELTFSGRTLGREAIDLCPGAGGAIVRSTAQGMAIAARTGRLDLNGRLKATPIRIVSGATSFSNPGTLSADVLTPAPGPPPLQVRQLAGSAPVTLVWPRRRPIPGCDCSPTLQLSGLITCHSGSRMVYTPRSELLLTPARS